MQESTKLRYQQKELTAAFKASLTTCSDMEMLNFHEEEISKHNDLWWGSSPESSFILSGATNFTFPTPAAQPET